LSAHGPDKTGVRNIRFRGEFRGATRLVGLYFFVSVATLVGVFFLRDDQDMVNQSVWIRCSIIAATSVLLLLFIAAAARGSAGGYKRARIASVVLLVSVVVVLVLPGAFPLWIKAAEGVSGLLLAGIVYILNRASTRALFA
jgi:hypothetical protein